jgi:hypothetical protein
MRLTVALVLLRAIVNRANTDPVYLEQIRTNPVDVLVKEGLPYDVIEDFLMETAMQFEVCGYQVVDCANTCALTTAEAYPEVFRPPGP